VYGSLIGAGADSARLTATALDVASGRPLAEIELRDAANRMDRMADSLTVRLLRELGRTRGIQVLRTGSLGSTSLPALKAFLQGEQWFRRAAWDSALAAYQRAVAIDSQFPVAIRREWQVLGWQRSALSPESQALALKAGALNHGLAPRDSLFITADSIQGALYASIPHTDWSQLRRLHAIADELTRRYPEDHEAWYLMGEARYHFGYPLGIPPAEALAAFDRAIASDSSFAPSYIHPIELALWLGNAEASDRYARDYLRLEPTDVSISGAKLTHQIHEILKTRPQALDSVLRGASPTALDDSWLSFRRAADSFETAVAITRALVAAPTGDADWLPAEVRERYLGITLGYRGHLREGIQHLAHNPQIIPPQLVEFALMGARWNGADAQLRALVNNGPLPAGINALPWYLVQRDTSTIRRLARRSDSLLQSTPDRVVRQEAIYASAAAQAYLALLHRDTADALRRLEALPDSLCALCYMTKLTRAQLLSARKDDRKADELLKGWLIFPILPSEVLWTLERARVAERLGEREKATQAYQYVADVWRHGDPEVQPYVAEAKQGLARLTAER
jgi:eukaryotic-like serine/threonine-protein kinase